MRVLVTGAAGFIGSRLTSLLLARGHDVLSLIRPATTATDLVGTVVRCDIADRSALISVFAATKPEAVAHLAWFTGPDYWNAPENLDHVAQSCNLLKAAAASGCRRFVGAGTCAEYDWSQGVLDELTTPCAPSTLYGTAKYALFLVAQQFARTHGLSFAWPRYNFLFGVHEKRGRLLRSAIESLQAGEDFPCTRGDQIRDFMHVDQAASATAALLESDVQGPVNIGSGEAKPLRVLLEMIARAIGGAGRPVFGAVPTRAGDPALLEPRLERLHGEVHWRPDVSLEETLLQTVRDFAISAHRSLARDGHREL